MNVFQMSRPCLSIHSWNEGMILTLAKGNFGPETLDMISMLMTKTANFTHGNWMQWKNVKKIGSSILVPTIGIHTPASECPTFFLLCVCFTIWAKLDSNDAVRLQQQIHSLIHWDCLHILRLIVRIWCTEYRMYIHQHALKMMERWVNTPWWGGGIGKDWG